MAYRGGWLQIGFGVFIGLLAQAQAATPLFPEASYRLIRTEGGMPRCLISEAKTMDPPAYIVFKWNDDPYEREIFASYHRPPQRYGRRAFDFYQLDLDCRSRRIPALTRSTAELRESEGQGLFPRSPTIWVKPETQEVFGIPLTPEMRSAFMQIRRAGELFLAAEEQTPGQYLAKHPIPQFNLELDRELTRKYGMAFASGVYKEWLDQQPDNRRVRENILAMLRAGRGAQAVPAELFQDTVFAIVKGYGHNTPGNPFDSLQTQLAQMGLDARIMTTDPHGGIDENALQLVPQFDQMLREGKRLIIMAGCVGVTESIGALAELSDRLNQKTPGYGSVTAIFSFSGMIGGSFLADWATDWPKWFFIRPRLFEAFKSQGGPAESEERLDSMKTLRTDFVQPYLAARWSRLPKDIVVFNLVGTLVDGLSRMGSAVRSIQDSIISTQLKTGLGANDGYIEYPGTIIPSFVARKSYVIAANASHNFLDGKFEEVPLDGVDALAAIMGALLNQLHLDNM